MGRKVKDWKPDLVASAEVAPHRYLWSGAIDAVGNVLPDPDAAPDFKAFKAAVPYQAGDVVYVDRGGVPVKARIIDFWWDRDLRERTGEKREMYRVQFETAAGMWSKLWERTHPGFIQRGYKLAGLAPDVLD